MKVQPSKFSYKITWHELRVFSNFQAWINNWTEGKSRHKFGVHLQPSTDISEEIFRTSSDIPKSKLAEQIQLDWEPYNLQLQPKNCWEVIKSLLQTFPKGLPEYRPDIRSLNSKLPVHLRLSDSLRTVAQLATSSDKFMHDYGVSQSPVTNEDPLLDLSKSTKSVQTNFSLLTEAEQRYFLSRLSRIWYVNQWHIEFPPSEFPSKVL